MNNEVPRDSKHLFIFMTNWPYVGSTYHSSHAVGNEAYTQVHQHLPAEWYTYVHIYYVCDMYRNQYLVGSSICRS